MAKMTADNNDIRSRIHKISETSVQPKVLVYANAGVGKSYLLATAPKALILLTEPEVSRPTLKLVKRTYGVDFDTIDIMSWDDFGDAYAYLYAGNHTYSTVCIDSLTDLVRRLIEHVLGLATAKRATHDPDILEMGDWNKVIEKLRQAVRAYRDLPMAVVMSALVLDIRSEMLKVPMVQPKNFALELPAYFNTVGYLGIDVNDEGETVRKLLLSPTDEYVAKNPGGALPDVVVNPNLAEMFPWIQAALEDK